MADPFIGEIRMFAGNFAPRYWAFCDGQIIAITQNEALFALLSTHYGGNGTTTFALPDMRGRVPIHAGQGPGLSNRVIGQKGGQETVLVTTDQLPAHNHAPLIASENPGSGNAPAGKILGKTEENFYSTSPSPSGMHSQTVGSIGGGQRHENLMPCFCINFIIALQGIYPPRD